MNQLTSRKIGVPALSVLVFAIGFGMIQALDLWTTSVRRQETRRALQQAARRASRERDQRPFAQQVGAMLREQGYPVAPGDITLRVQPPAARLVWSYPARATLPLRDPERHVVTHFLPSEVARRLTATGG